MRCLRVFAVASLLIGCGSHGARSTVQTLVSDIDARDADGAIEHMVSDAQLAKIVTCATPTSAPWLTAAERKTRLDTYRSEYATASPTKHVRLGPLFEDYDREGQWHSYAKGDLVHGDCRANEAFSIEVHRIVLVITDFDRPTESTKPIELWKIDGKFYSWDDPMDTEGWH